MSISILFQARCGGVGPRVAQRKKADKSNSAFIYIGMCTALDGWGGWWWRGGFTKEGGADSATKPRTDRMCPSTWRSHTHTHMQRPQCAVSRFVMNCARTKVSSKAQNLALSVCVIHVPRHAIKQYWPSSTGPAHYDSLSLDGHHKTAFFPLRNACVFGRASESSTRPDWPAIKIMVECAAKRPCRWSCDAEWVRVGDCVVCACFF